MVLLFIVTKWPHSSYAWSLSALLQESKLKNSSIIIEYNILKSIDNFSYRGLVLLVMFV